MAGDATIFIPGIKGTKLVNTNLATWDTIWSGVQSNFESIEDLELTAGVAGQYYEEDVDTIAIAGEIETLAYGEFLGDLKGKAPLYIFNYDWRLSAVENGKRLGSFMDYVVAKSKARSVSPKTIKKFDFITHSLGNAVLRNLLHREGMRRVNKIVFTVPPFLGSLDIVVAALIGEGFFKGVQAKIRKLIRTMPGALELLPIYAKASHFTPAKKHSFFTFNHWQSNVTKPGTASSKMKKALAVAKKTVNGELMDLSKLSKSERERILILVRGGVETWQSVNVRARSRSPKNLVDFESGLRTDDGDGRVPHVSSCGYHADVQTLIIEDAFWFRDYDHGFFLKDERAQKLVNRFLFDNKFRPRIPGGSVKRVTGVVEKQDPKTKRPYWTVTSKAP